MTPRCLILMAASLALASCEQTHGSVSPSWAESPPKGSIRDQTERCWIVDLGLPGIERMEVSIKVEFDRNGAVTSTTVMADQDKLSDINYAKFLESARRAILKCSPYKFPASAPYEAWKTTTITFRFNLKDMDL